ncbi:MAG: transposase, partial [Flavobacteriales bacterium]
STQSDDRLLERHQLIAKKLNKGLTVREIASMFGCSTTTVVKVLAKRDELRTTT